MAGSSKSKVQGDVIDLDSIINKARSNFSRNEKGLGNQITTGSNIFRPTEDSHFICWKDSPWETLVGIRGVPFGRIVQIAGRPDSGKSTHAMAFMKQAQDQGIVVILWDAENKFSANRFDNYFDITEPVPNVDNLVGAARMENPLRIYTKEAWDATLIRVEIQFKYGKYGE